MVVVFQEAIPGGTKGSYVDIERLDTGWHAKTSEGYVPVASVTLGLGELGLDHYKTILMDDCHSATVIRFADLHRHSDNSLLDGMTKVLEMVARTEYAGALTDHGNMYGFCEYYKAMKDAGKKPIIGVEVYTYDLDESGTNRHLLLLAKNKEGYHNLLELVSESFDHFYRHPHVTWEMLEKRHEGIIASAACLGGVIQKYVTKGQFDKAEEALLRYVNIFGKEDFYLEIQRHHLMEEPMIEDFFMDMAEKHGLKIIATTDSHYPTTEDAYPHEIMLCMQRQATITGEHWKFEGDGYHLHSSEEMEMLFHDHPEWLDNTLELADRCNVEIELGHVNLPKYDIPAPFTTSDAYFEHLCEEGFKRRFQGTEHLTEQTYKDRFDYEMDMIKKMGFSGYFLIVQDYIGWAREHDIYVGPGRGSAAGSLLAYCLGITDLDPIKYNLLFERFLNPERVTMPD